MEAKKAKVNREFKDGMFRTLFNDKEKMLELYNAVSEEQMGKEAIDEIETLTIETPLYIGSRNDLAFLIDGRVCSSVSSSQPDREIWRSDCHHILARL